MVTNARAGGGATRQDTPSIRHFIERWPGRVPDLARTLGISEDTVYAWCRRNRIPEHWWERLEAAGRRCVVAYVTYNALRRLHAARRVIVRHTNPALKTAAAGAESRGCRTHHPAKSQSVQLGQIGDGRTQTLRR